MARRHTVTKESNGNIYRGNSLLILLLKSEVVGGGIQFESKGGKKTEIKEYDTGQHKTDKGD